MHNLRFAAVGLVYTLFGMPATADTVQDFFTAIRSNDLARVRELSRDPSTLKLADSKGITPLLYASAFGSLDAVRTLIDAGADVNAAEAQGTTPLHWAACDPARVKLLLGHGAKADSGNAEGRTPLIVASGCESAGESVRMLLEKGANVNARQANGATPLYEAARGGGPRICRMLLTAGAKVDVATERGMTPLMDAVGLGDIELVKMLIARGAQVNARNTSSGTVRHGEVAMKQITPLMFATPFGSAEMVKTLLDAGADAKMRDSRSMTPLMFAVASDHQDVRVVKLLVERGSDVNAVSSAGETVLDWALKFNEPAIVTLLEKAGAKSNPVPAVPVRRTAAEPDPKAAVAKSVALLQRVSAEFFKESGCVGCHHQPMMAMAVKAARDSGVAVDEKDLAEQRKAMAVLLSPRPSRILLAPPGGGQIDNLVFVGGGLWSAGYAPDLLTDSIAVGLANEQGSDGGFGATETVSRAPMEESAISRTALAIRTLQVYSFPSRKAEFEQRIARARAWLMEATPRTEYERADVLLGLYWSGAPADQVKRAANALLAIQRPDGGWAQRAHLSSDAYMTGIALRALRESGQLRTSDESYRKGVDYLLRTQMEDGSWYVRSRAVKLQPYFQSGFPYDHDQWISYAATAYATMALAGAEHGRTTRASAR
jgi:ankyrin repeat protein